MPINWIQQFQWSRIGVEIYARVESKEGINCNLVFAKSRVGPLKQSLPQKELLGASLLLRVFATIESVYLPSLMDLESHYFSDSETVLC